MAKLKLTPNPTFKAKVAIPVPGSAPVPVEFTFRHRSKSEAEAFVADGDRPLDASAVMDMAIAWELDDEFNAENVERMLENYLGSALAIFSTYVKELRGAREKN